MYAVYSSENPTAASSSKFSWTKDGAGKENSSLAEVMETEHSEMPEVTHNVFSTESLYEATTSNLISDVTDDVITTTTRIPSMSTNPSDDDSDQPSRKKRQLLIKKYADDVKNSEKTVDTGTIKSKSKLLQSLRKNELM